MIGFHCSLHFILAVIFLGPPPFLLTFSYPAFHFFLPPPYALLSPPSLHVTSSLPSPSKRRLQQLTHVQSFPSTPCLSHGHSFPAPLLTCRLLLPLFPVTAGQEWGPCLLSDWISWRCSSKGMKLLRDPNSQPGSPHCFNIPAQESNQLTLSPLTGSRWCDFDCMPCYT